MKPLYIIPARGGSKGIPHKNIKPLGGRPLIAYSIDAAKAACAVYPGYIMLSTDDEEIADTARKCGLAVDYMRPVELATDTSASRDFMLDAMDWATEHGIDYDCVVLLQPTSPFREAEDITGAMRLYTGEEDMIVSVCRSDANPYYNLFETDACGNLHVCKGDGLYTRRQDAPEVLEYNGGVYVIKPESLRAMPMGEFPVRKPYIMPQERSIDLDTPADWARAEEIMKEKWTKGI